MRAFNVGQKVVIIENAKENIGEYYKVGDKGSIIDYLDEITYLVDIIGKGLFYITENSLKEEMK